MTDDIKLAVKEAVQEALQPYHEALQALAGELSPDHEFTVDEALEYTGLRSRHSLYMARSRNELPSIKRGKYLFFKKADLDAWMSSRTQ